MSSAEITIDVVQGNVLTFEADVLAVKDAVGSGGLDAQIRRRLKEMGFLTSSTPFLPPTEYRVYPGIKISRTKHILVVGSPSIYELHYSELRTLGRRFLEALWEAKVDVRHLATTVQGVKTSLGLDETEAFRSLLLGISDAYEYGNYPPMLERITFVELNERRAELLQRTLKDFLPPVPPLPTHLMIPVEETNPVASIVTFEPEARKPEADETTPFIFVAMPFKDDYDDQFYLAIQPCVKDAGCLCERMDLDTFTGDIMDRMFERIRSAQLMIALLDGANPNVYLEVGYAWCAGTPTILIAHHSEKLPFDVQSHRVLIYDKIHKLKNTLADELVRLLEN